MNKGKTILLFAILGLVVCNLYFGVSWFVAKNDLRTVREANEQLAQENRQHSAAVQEADSQLEIANEQVALASAKVADLTDRLAESQKFGEYWWERGHPREFQSLDELKAWLAQDDTDSTLNIVGSTNFGNYDCDDYAVALMYNALSDGYLVSLQIEDSHMLNCTVIGNGIYFIEPQSDKVWLWGYRD
jgi:hypothetical protein